MRVTAVLLLTLAMHTQLYATSYSPPSVWAVNSRIAIVKEPPDSLHIYSMKTGALLDSKRGINVDSIMWNEQKQQFFVTEYDSRLDRFRTATWNEEGHPLDVGAWSPLRFREWTPGKRVAVISSEGGTQVFVEVGGALRRFDIESFEGVKQFIDTGAAGFVGEGPYLIDLEGELLEQPALPPPTPGESFRAWKHTRSRDGNDVYCDYRSGDCYLHDEGEATRRGSIPVPQGAELWRFATDPYRDRAMYALTDASHPGTSALYKSIDGISWSCVIDLTTEYAVSPPLHFTPEAVWLQTEPKRSSGLHWFLMLRNVACEWDPCPAVEILSNDAFD